LYGPASQVTTICLLSFNIRFDAGCHFSHGNIQVNLADTHTNDEDFPIQKGLISPGLAMRALDRPNNCSGLRLGYGDPCC